MKKLDLKRKVEKLSGDFTVSGGDPIKNVNGQPVAPVRVGTLEDIAIRVIDAYRGRTASESLAAYALGKKIKDAEGVIQVNDEEYAYLTKIYDTQIAPVVAAFHDMVTQLNS